MPFRCKCGRTFEKTDSFASHTSSCAPFHHRRMSETAVPPLQTSFSLFSQSNSPTQDSPDSQKSSFFMPTALSLHNAFEGARRRALFACPYADCTKIYSKEWKLHEHVLIHTGQRPFVCTHPGCDKTYRASKHLTVHARTHQDPIYKCSYPGCSQAYSISHHLKRHELKHKDTFSIKCTWPECTAVFEKKHQLRSHMSTHTHKLPWPCDVENCDASFIVPSKLKKHKLTIHSDKPRYLCSLDECECAFANWTELCNHMREKHPKICSECGKEFNRQSRLNQHYKNKHAEREPVPCTYSGCERVFSSTKVLNMHINLVHERVNKFMCTFPGCEKGFPYKSIYERHLAHHSRSRKVAKRPFGFERKLGCPFEGCTSTFTTEYTLKRHITSKKHKPDIDHYEASAAKRQKSEGDEEAAMHKSDSEEPKDRGQVLMNRECE
ncbi:hypothetical protein CLU79DRAFT_830119 [Phycomyces nitens]|nr:hypothetical protein CLU79DRAFT_830119 [Phycomyces nitens]